MPAKSLSDRFPFRRLGRIKLGIAAERDGCPLPRPADHFVCPATIRKVYGEKPGVLRILFPSEDDSRWAWQSYRCYSRTRGLICRGDGEKAVALIDRHTGSLVTRDSVKTSRQPILCNPSTCRYYGRNCRRITHLQFILPDVPGLGVWQIDTSSYWSMININSGVQLLRQVCGRVSMVPLMLKLVPKAVQPQGQRRTVYVLALDAPYKMVEIVRYGPRRRTDSKF